MEVLRSEYRLQEAYTGSRSSAMYSKDGATRREEAVCPCDDRRWRRHRVHHWGVYVCANEAEAMKPVYVRCDDNVVGCLKWKMPCELDTCRTYRSQHRDFEFYFSLQVLHGAYHFPWNVSFPALVRSDRLQHDRLWRHVPYGDPLRQCTSDDMLQPFRAISETGLHESRQDPTYIKNSCNDGRGCA